jgi:hypothetical protein
MNEPRIPVNFNEMVSHDEVLLSRDDIATASDGSVVLLREGVRLAVYEDDVDAQGKVDRLIADGTAALNQHGGWTAGVRWTLKIDAQGVRHESEPH